MGCVNHTIAAVTTDAGNTSRCNNGAAASTAAFTTTDHRLANAAPTAVGVRADEIHDENLDGAVAESYCALLQTTDVNRQDDSPDDMHAYDVSTD